MRKTSFRFGLAALAAIVAVTLPSCSKGGGGSGGEGGGGGTISVAPSPVEFADAPPGVASDRTVTIQNGSGAAATISRVAIVGDTGGVFALHSDDGHSQIHLPASIAPGSALDLHLTYTPAAPGEDAAVLEVDSDLAGTISVPLAGRCIAAGVVADPATVDFGPVPKGTTRQLQVEIRNVSSGQRTLTGVTLADSASAQFAISGVPALPATLAPGEGRAFTASVTPSTAGVIQGQVAVESDDAERPSFAVDLAAEGMDVPPALTEFAVNRTVPLDQRRPAVAALPTADSRGAMAVVIFETNHDAHQHFSTSAIDAGGVAVGNSPDPKIAHHTEGVGYVGVASDPTTSSYSAPVRWHPWNENPESEQHPRSVFLGTIRSTGGDDGGKLIGEYERLPSAQNVTTMDVAADPSGPRFTVFRVSGTATTTTALPQGLLGRLTNRTGTVMLSPLFAISSVNDFTTQRNPRVAFEGERWLTIWEQSGAIAGRQFAREGTAVGADFVVTDVGTSNAARARIAANPATGDCLVVWEQGELAGRIVRRDGTLGPVVALNAITTGAQERPAPACNPATGEWMVVWSGPDASGRGVYARRFDASLVPAGDEVQVNVLTDGEQHEPAVTWAPVAGKWLVVWTGLDTDGMGVRGRLVQ